MVRSAFMGTFGEEAMKWLSLLTAPQYDYIVAIARKCPRLIDVILRESSLPVQFVFYFRRTLLDDI